MKKKQDKEDQYHTQNIVKPSVQEYNYMVKYKLSLSCQTIYPQNSKNIVSTKLCDESQPINSVQYRQRTFFLGAIFRHVYPLWGFKNVFLSFLTSYICT